MSKQYNFDTVVERKNTKSLKYDFAVKRGMPEDILPLWVADMDFKVADEILEAMQRQLDHGIFGYSESDDGYIKAVRAWMQKRHGFHIHKKWIVKTPGIVYAIAMAVQAYTTEGESVLIQPPVYYPFRSVIEDNGRKVIENPLVMGADGRFHFDYEDLERKIIENNVKLFLFCSPHNPVSRVWTKNELQKIADLCIKHDVIVFCDEIHQDFVYGNHKHTVFLNVDERLHDRTIIATSPSKTFNLAGVQASNLFIPNRELRQKLIGRIHASGYSQLNVFGLISCEAAYTYGEIWLDELREYLTDNIRFVKEFLKSELPTVKLIDPEGTYLLWLDFRALGLQEQQINKKMVMEAKVWLDHGTMFGVQGDGFQRINIACPRVTLERALIQMKSVFGE